MCASGGRYGDAYGRYWAPVIAPGTRALLERLDGLVSTDRPMHVVDVGTGSGTLAIASLERWARARVTGVDPSARLLELAREEGHRRGDAINDRLQLMEGTADRLPVDEGSADLTVSSFVIQLVPSRKAMVRELFRVLKGDGISGVVTWQAGTFEFEAATVVERALVEFEIDAPAAGDSQPYVSPEDAASEFRSAGFEDVDARVDWLEHRYSVEGYLAVVEHWQYSEALEGVDRSARAELRAHLRRRLAELPAAKLGWRRPLISVVARRPPH